MLRHLLLKGSLDGKEKMPCRCDGGTDAHMPADSMRLLRSADVGCLPHPTNRNYLAGKLLSYALRPSVGTAFDGSG